MASSANISNTDRQRKQRRNLSLEDKVNIIKRKETDVKLSDEKLANEFTTESDISYIRNIIRRLDDLEKSQNAKTLLTESIDQ